MESSERNPREIFAAALGLTEGARNTYLEKSCSGDDALRREVQSLLQAYEQAGDFLVQGLAAASMGGMPEQPGMVIGRYKLLEQIGEGGFGTVWLADQLEPVHRKVALKAIKPGMDTKEVVARFEAERQALALMEHPNIARVLDGGVMPSGRPFFVMELVPGIPIIDFCDQNLLATADRLKLFIKVCRALQHAHQQGIVHRDIKPSNVLVILQDGEPVPKIIDFGIAKALGQRLTERTLLTSLHHLIGTPVYMSPEQAQLNGGDLDARSDIYSLGVLLYELLTGVTPFDKATLAKAALDEVRRLIREAEPPKPSTQLESLGQKLTEVAKRRQAEPSTLRRLVRGDLDWIVMTCLDKDRDRRYATASSLAEDLDRYLSSQPVKARPPTAAYRLDKFVRRHRGEARILGAVVLTLLIAAAVGGWLFARQPRLPVSTHSNGILGSALFDGRTFSGWDGDASGTFRIKDGAIVGGSMLQALPEPSYLCTTKSYTNFILRLEFKIVGTNGSANSGVQFRSQRVAGTQQVTGYQADIGEGYWGGLYDQTRRDKVLAAADLTAVSKVVKPHDWNEYVIRAEGPRIRFWLNGYPTIDYTETDSAIPLYGIIGFQIHCFGPMEASFRRISIEVLP